MPNPSPKTVNSQLSLTSKPQFYQETAADAALDQLQNDYHPEADDLQIFSILLNRRS